MKGKPNICISSIACWGISLGNKEKRNALWSPLNFLVKISFPPFKSKGKFWFTLGGHGISVWHRSPVQLLCKTFCWCGSGKVKQWILNPMGKTHCGGDGATSSRGRSPHHDTQMGPAAASIYRNVLFFSFFDLGWASYSWFMALGRAEGWSVRCWAVLLPLLVFQ